MPRLGLVTPDVLAIEGHRPDLLVLEYHVQQRPLSGLVEQVDWRMCGLVSRWIARGRITGELGEQVLIPPGRHLRCGQLLVLGMGAVPGPRQVRVPTSLDCNRATEQILATCQGLGARRLAMPLPGRAAGLISASVAAQLLSASVEGKDLEVVIIEENHLMQDVIDVI